MWFIILKYFLTAGIVVLASEVAKRTDRMGALIGSLPLVALLSIVWLYVEGQGERKVGEYAYYTFWYVLPTLPMFLVMPWLLAKSMNFWLSFVLCILLTVASFALTAIILKRFGINLMP
jgi:hypothetical protein